MHGMIWNSLDGRCRAFEIYISYTNATAGDHVSQSKTNILDRLRAVEDRLEILNILAGSALSADIGSEAYWADIFTEDAVLDQKPEVQHRGRDEILKLIGGENQRAAIEHGMAHLASLPFVTVNGDRASAIGYLLVVVRDEQARAVDLPGKVNSLCLSIYHLSVNRWEFIRTPTGWKVSNRIVRPLATKEAHEIIGTAFETPDGALA
jgi:ketosteroid isomerase-like protein